MRRLSVHGFMVQDDLFELGANYCGAGRGAIHRARE